MAIPQSPQNLFWQETTIGKAQRLQQLKQKPMAVWFTGLSGAGKSTVANSVEVELHRLGYATYLLDGDNVRQGLCRDLGFSQQDRAENVRRVGEVARLMVDAGLIVLASFISPNQEQRQAVRARFDASEFFEVFISTPLAVCEQRDPKGLYKLARTGKVEQFTGISAPYEVPVAPELTIDASNRPVVECARQVIDYVLAQQPEIHSADSPVTLLR